jgi:hypothetical protein
VQAGSHYSPIERQASAQFSAMNPEPNLRADWHRDCD